MGGRILALVIKELLAIARDRSGRMVLIGPPIVQLFVFAFAATLEVKNISIAILDHDRGVWSRELVERFHGSPVFQTVTQVGSTREIRALVDAQKVIGALTIPQHFSSDIKAGRPTALQIVLDGRRANAAQIVEGYVGQIIENISQTAHPLKGRGAQAGQLVVRNWFNPNLDYHWFTVPSLIGTIGLLLGISITALSIARERELGTFDQLLVSPLRPAEILIGKTLPSLLIGLAQGTVFLGIAVLIFGIPFAGSLGLLFLSLTVYLIAVIGVGLFISAMSQTQQQAFLGAFLFSAPAILLSGFATPVENMPGWLQTASVINPLRHFLVIVNGLFTKNMGAETVFENIVPLVLIALVTMVAAAFLFTRRLG
ncbi:MAG: ABC transporter permease [Alphaproteobacteria bacterium]